MAATGGSDFVGRATDSDSPTHIVLVVHIEADTDFGTSFMGKW